MMKKMYVGLVAMIKSVPVSLKAIQGILETMGGNLISLNVKMDGLTGALDAIEAEAFEAAEISREVFLSPELRMGPGCIALSFGGEDAFLYGGPYLQKPDDISGVKMAKEIAAPCMVDIPTVDFQVPDVAVLEANIWKALVILRADGELYAGCMGGVGRTGLFMACMLSVSWHVTGFNTELPEPEFTDAIIAQIRKDYHEHAVETDDQREMVMNFDAELIASHVVRSGLFS